MIKLSVALLTIFPLVQAAAAEDAPVYESLSGLPIGRVFFTPAERERLDQQRKKTPRKAAPTSEYRGTAAQTQQTNPDAAGYITNGEGQSRIWKRGEFVSTTRSPAEDVAFPGEIKVKRHERAAENDD